MKILWASNSPWAPSGYGQQTALFAPRIQKAGHDVALFSTWGLMGAGLEWNGLRVYPSDEKWGNDMLPDYATLHGDGNMADCQVITLMDVFVLLAEQVGHLNLACWVPVDHDPVPPRVTEFFRKSGARPIAMSKFGQRALEQEGFEPLYAPHAVDTNVFRNDIDRQAVRHELGLDEDAFVVGMVAANQGKAPPRKAFPQVFQAFAGFHHDHPNARLFLHTEVSGVNLGLNLLDLAEKCGIPPHAVGTSDQLALRLGFVTPQELAQIYSSMDVLVNPSYGEGFGIPIIEAQACGVPVIVSDFTAMPELCGAGWLVRGDKWFDALQDSFFICPAVSGIRAALDEAYEHAHELRGSARAFALGYDADLVMAEHWLPILAELEATRPAKPVIEEIVQPNRAQRRAAKKVAVG